MVRIIYIYYRIEFLKELKQLKQSKNVVFTIPTELLQG